MGKFIATKNSENDINSIDVSSYAKKPFKEFSPFMNSKNFEIPVPGQENTFAQSVEGIWQGLKVIDGGTDFGIFYGCPKKRKKGTYMGHLYDNKRIDIVTARELIYEPSYIYYLKNCVKASTLEKILILGINEDVKIHDTENNLDPNNSNVAVGHSFYLAKFLNKELNDRIELVTNNIKELYLTKEFKHETLAEPIARLIDLYNESSKLNRQIISKELNNQCYDEFKNRFYQKSLEYLKA